MEKYEFLKDLAIILLSAKIFGIVAKKFKAPQVVGEIIAGLIVGNCLLGLVQESDFISGIAEIGVIMLMFEAGLGTNMKKLKETGVKATIIACAGVFIPLILGTILYMSFYGFASYGTEEFTKALFIGTIMTATSVSITVAALKEMGKLSSTVGTTIMSAAIIDDVIGIIVLTMVLGLRDTTQNPGMVIVKSVLFFVIAAVSGVVVYRVFAWLDTRYEHTRRITIASLAYCLAMAYVAEKYFGIADITGAYVAGIVLCNLADASYIERRVDISSYMVFAPVFFAGIGLKTSFDSMNSTLLVFSIAFVIVALLGKIVGCGLVSKALKFNWSDSLKIGLGMMTRGEVALIVTNKGLEAGIISNEYFSAVILLIIISSISTPLLLKAVYNKDEKKKLAA
ncbi:cation:proton antiporter [Butyrivibrio fibrisolvens]|uniref:Kef-type K+ transport system, membrane component KefB n=1 Tax=Butyrivibrio fibrisolvens TaxID=831 RepID=A0A1H9TKR6_BUTFI|nr:cation:proton antiporter [Butyrivibrio fibrisolvens]SER97718.1 Kef-type K+ transport system, membrane component KefB [Butyrivibrio fibrisolvens]